MANASSQVDHWHCRGPLQGSMKYKFPLPIELELNRRDECSAVTGMIWRVRAQGPMT